MGDVNDNICQDSNDAANSSPTNASSHLPRKTSFKGIKSLCKLQSSSFYGLTKEKVNIPNMKNLMDCEESQVEETLVEKLQFCCTIFDFSVPNSNLKAKDAKRSILLEITSFLSENPRFFTQKIYRAVFKMISHNILRVLPPYENKDPDLDDENPVFEASWPHLNPTYELFLMILELNEFNVKMASSYLNLDFIRRLLNLFDTEDARERECLKTLLHRIYGKFITFRNEIRSMVNNLFLCFVYETQRFNGISELLEIYGSIINGFALPLKEEHKKFLLTVLLPLHKPKSLSMYFGQLSYCVLQFIDKDQDQILSIIRFMIRYWPKTSSQKEILFLTQLEEILETCVPESFVQVMDMSFRKIANCCRSEHFQVSEKALCFWQNEIILQHFTANSESLIPLVFDLLYKTATCHWNGTINSIALSIINVIIEINPKVCLKIYRIQKNTFSEDDEGYKNFKCFLEKFTNLRPE